MLKTVALSLVFGFIGAALFGRLFPPASPYDYIAVVSYTDKDGKEITQAQAELVQRRADLMAKSGFIILNSSAVYKYPPELKVTQTISAASE